MRMTGDSYYRLGSSSLLGVRSGHGLIALLILAACGSNSGSPSSSNPPGNTGTENDAASSGSGSSSGSSSSSGASGGGGSGASGSGNNVEPSSGASNTGDGSTTTSPEAGMVNCPAVDSTMGSGTARAVTVDAQQVVGTIRSLQGAHWNPGPANQALSQNYVAMGIDMIRTHDGGGVRARAPEMWTGREPAGWSPA